MEGVVFTKTRATAEVRGFSKSRFLRFTHLCGTCFTENVTVRCARHSTLIPD
jgi:hypothetical protein